MVYYYNQYKPPGKVQRHTNDTRRKLWRKKNLIIQSIAPVKHGGGGMGLLFFISESDLTTVLPQSSVASTPLCSRKMTQSSYYSFGTNEWNVLI